MGPRMSHSISSPTRQENGTYGSAPTARATMSLVPPQSPLPVLPQVLYPWSSKEAGMLEMENIKLK